MQLLNHVSLARQRTHQPEQQMNFHLGKSMNCPMRLGLSKTTYPQRLREQNPVKVVFVLYDSKPSRSCSRLCPLFLLVGPTQDKMKTKKFVKFGCGGSNSDDSDAELSGENDNTSHAEASRLDSTYCEGD
jgi:hypothetical protein